ncbi:GNAT family N-acetyltransferase [Kushneria phyllosphaerae]|uniref:Spermidine N(1)-acetyltransferase n=1 Tax=Kushneria phyllosphaerae TaxID=2100822 RepID=A0A2R8CK89_9GAMM|nr:GNAT family N-acetyltransferase [Kushneria phyllosphaerae]SPJ33299.1 Spermidine N(1)-acetyltransferase [Kushneria phyllosphaerae]
MSLKQEGQRWLIRQARMEDAEAVCRIFNHEEVFPNTMQLPFSSPSYWQQRLECMDRGHHMLAACHPQAPETLLGLIGLHPVAASARVAHVRTIGLSVDPDYAGQGIGSQLLRAAIDLADNWLNVTRLSLGVYSHNHRAIELYERHGFVKEGLSRGISFGHGRYLDSLEMARLHPRFEQALEAQGRPDETQAHDLSQQGSTRC